MHRQNLFLVILIFFTAFFSQASKAPKGLVMDLGHLIQSGSIGNGNENRQTSFFKPSVTFNDETLEKRLGSFLEKTKFKFNEASSEQAKKFLFELLVKLRGNPNNTQNSEIELLDYFTFISKKEILVIESFLRQKKVCSSLKDLGEKALEIDLWKYWHNNKLLQNVDMYKKLSQSAKDGGSLDEWLSDNETTYTSFALYFRVKLKLFGLNGHGMRTFFSECFELSKTKQEDELELLFHVVKQNFYCGEKVPDEVVLCFFSMCFVDEKELKVDISEKGLVVKSINNYVKSSDALKNNFWQKLADLGWSKGELESKIVSCDLNLYQTGYRFYKALKKEKCPWPNDEELQSLRQFFKRKYMLVYGGTLTKSTLKFYRNWQNRVIESYGLEGIRLLAELAFNTPCDDTQIIPEYLFIDLVGAQTVEESGKGYKFSEGRHDNDGLFLRAKDKLSLSSDKYFTEVVRVIDERGIRKKLEAEYFFKGLSLEKYRNINRYLHAVQYKNPEDQITLKDFGVNLQDLSLFLKLYYKSTLKNSKKECLEVVKTMREVYEESTSKAISCYDLLRFDMALVKTLEGGTISVKFLTKMDDGNLEENQFILEFLQNLEYKLPQHQYHFWEALHHIPIKELNKLLRTLNKRLEDSCGGKKDNLINHKWSLRVEEGLSLEISFEQMRVLLALTKEQKITKGQKKHYEDVLEELKKLTLDEYIELTKKLKIPDESMVSAFNQAQTLRQDMLQYYFDEEQISSVHMKSSDFTKGDESFVTSLYEKKRQNFEKELKAKSSGEKKRKKKKKPAQQKAPTLLAPQPLDNIKDISPKTPPKAPIPVLPVKTEIESEKKAKDLLPAKPVVNKTVVGKKTMEKFQEESQKDGFTVVGGQGRKKGQGLNTKNSPEEHNKAKPLPKKPNNFTAAAQTRTSKTNTKANESAGKTQKAPNTKASVSLQAPKPKKPIATDQPQKSSIAPWAHLTQKPKAAPNENATPRVTILQRGKKLPSMTAKEEKNQEPVVASKPQAKTPNEDLAPKERSVKTQKSKSPTEQVAAINANWQLETLREGDGKLNEDKVKNLLEFLYQDVSRKTTIIGHMLNQGAGHFMPKTHSNQAGMTADQIMRSIKNLDGTINSDKLMLLLQNVNSENHNKDHATGYLVSQNMALQQQIFYLQQQLANQQSSFPQNGGH